MILGCGVLHHASSVGSLQMLGHCLVSTVATCIRMSVINISKDFGTGVKLCSNTYVCTTTTHTHTHVHTHTHRHTHSHIHVQSTKNKTHLIASGYFVLYSS